MRLAIVSSHPIQYNAPLFAELSRRQGLDLRVFYGWEGTARQDDPGFGAAIAWDVPLLDGYASEIVPNRSGDPGTHHFGGLDNPEMVARISAWGPDAVLVFGWAFRTHLRVMRHFKGRCPVLFRGDSTLQTGAGGPFMRPLRDVALRWVYRHVDVALYPGQRNREYLRASGLSEERMAWMPHAIDTARFGDDRSKAPAEAERRALGIGEADTVFLFAGKFVQRKGCELLIRAFRQAAGANRRTHLVLVGAGPLENTLRAVAAGGPGIHFAGFRNQVQMPMVYRVGDCFVLPSSKETWGLCVNEAMAAGRAVITSDRVGAAPDLVEGKPYGRVFTSGSSADLAGALLRFMVPRSELESLGRAAQSAIEAWSIPAAADALMEALGNLRSFRP